ncbi:MULTISPECIES: hypothetical protein [Nitrosococcus]|uniref:Uncharacterized protein n=2 Tax=Nitrosococcus TaxID=1227 RepID=D8KCC4_NITWC|nr:MULTISPECIES: hypothetical protein [Nitrosococcus]ADJ29865.1 hypothetical protein Nwat_3148 [Nitrosococcus watsonii C-113]EDZ65251.1 hypothetical protein NOC27_3415 [Nitrosococcus oceani AFC27]KFI17780.1 hypothetical protein IB75_18650 [Nitrosococcus oceani C-27]BBM60789.1 hypothetical protein NONS58_P0030 [Nitrosococcus oceani]
MRRIFQLDGLDKGILSVGERQESNQIALCISHANQEAQILLSEEAFKELAHLRYVINFQSNDEEQSLKAVQ